VGDLQALTTLFDLHDVSGDAVDDIGKGYPAAAAGARRGALTQIRAGDIEQAAYGWAEAERRHFGRDEYSKKAAMGRCLVGRRS
jgi:hypothetical protein